MVDLSLYKNVTLRKLIARNPDNAQYKKRVTMEFRIVNKTIKTLHSAGYDLGIDGYADKPVNTNKRQALVDMMFNLDECYLLAYVGGSQKGWIRFIFGECGYDVINDYTTNLEEVLKPVDALIDKLENGSR